jgi:hypothetical protein
MIESDQGNAFARSNGKRVIVSVERWGSLQGVALLDLEQASWLATELAEAIEDIEKRAGRC